MLKRFAEVMVVLMVLKTCNGLLLGDLEYVNCSAVVSQKSGRGDGLSHGGCSLWFTNETGECQPGPKLGGIIQQDLLTLQTSLQECYCITEDNGALVVGSCMYTCKAIMGYYPLPCRVSKLQNFTCAGLNRRWTSCGRCEDGYAIPVYSYDFGCVKCDNYK